MRSEMIQRLIYLVVGVALMVLGLVFLIGSFTGLTGFSVANEVNTPVRGVIGAGLFTAGLFFVSKSRGRKKGQAAMEFLMTYGWAILVAIIVIGVLSVIGIFSPSAPDSPVILSPPITSEGQSYTVGAGTESTMEIEIRNDGPKTVIIESYGLDIPECYLTDLTGGNEISLTPGDSAILTVYCAEGTTEDQMSKANFFMNYYTSGSGLVQISSEGGAVPGNSGDPQPGGEQGSYGLTQLDNSVTTINGDSNIENADVSSVLILNFLTDGDVCRHDASDLPFDQMSSGTEADCTVVPFAPLSSCTITGISDGQWERSISCMDTGTGEMHDSTNNGYYRGTLDSTPPGFSDVDPASESSVPIGAFTITVTTNEATSNGCRFSTSDIEFGEMVDVCTPSSSTEHRCEVPGGSKAGPLNYYISCSDDTLYDPNENSATNNLDLDYVVVEG